VAAREREICNGFLPSSLSSPVVTCKKQPKTQPVVCFKFLSLLPDLLLSLLF